MKWGQMAEKTNATTTEKLEGRHRPARTEKKKQEDTKRRTKSREDQRDHDGNIDIKAKTRTKPSVTISRVLTADLGKLSKCCKDQSQSMFPSGGSHEKREEQQRSREEETKRRKKKQRRGKRLQIQMAKHFPS